MLNNKAKLIENLTGVNSSKLNYYVELKKRNEEIIKQNKRLEILHSLIRDINIDMSIGDIIQGVYEKLPQVLPCAFIGLALLQRDELFMTAMMPKDSCLTDAIPAGSFLWHSIQNREAKVYEPLSTEDPFIKSSPLLASEIYSLTVSPLFVRASVKGLLLVGSTEENVYGHEELVFIYRLADQLAICIQNSQLYEQVSRAKREWEETFQAVTEPILLVDTFHNVLRCNDHLPAGLNLPCNKTGQSKCYEMLWGRDTVCDQCLMAEVKQTARPVYRRVQMESGHVLDVSYYPVFNEQNKLTAVIHHMKDVTEKTKMEAQLVHSARLAAIGEMAAGVAHELNNPMTVIIGAAQLMLRESEGEHNDNELLMDIINCGIRCKRIIQDLLTFSRQDQYPFALTDLNEEVERVLSLVSYQIKGNKINLTWDFQPELPRIIANGHQLQQVLINLLLNARDALEGAEEDKEIQVSTSVRENRGDLSVVVSVKDNGMGIAAENLTKIFNPFYTSKEATRGTGLGLSVSLGIAQAHGGAIEVSSVPGKGSCFNLVLPVVEEHEQG